MRRTRRIILVLIVLILAGVAISWRARKSLQSRQSPSKPISLPESVSARAEDWCWDEARQGKPVVRVCAKDMKNTSEGKIELTGVDLQLFHPDATTYDQVRSAKADFDLAAGVLFSDGEVEITMGVPVDPKAKPSSRLVTIKTSGARFESKTGKASTERAAEFQFQSGEGKCTGALYDPATRELQMHKDVRLHWKGDTPESTPMDVESGSLIYKEAESRIWLLPWSKFKRDTLAMEGGAAIVALKEGLIESIEAQEARGTDTRPKQQTHYSADMLTVRFNPQGVLQSVTGDKNAKLLSSTPTARTHVDAARLDLEFHVENQDSVLRKALGTGGTVVRSSPVPRQGVPIPDTRIMRSDVIAVYMRPGGEHMEHVDAEAPGTIEFVPNRPGQKRRVVTGNQMKILYAENNELKTFQAVDVATRSESEPVKGKPQSPALTWSKGMIADFEPKTGVMNKLEQWGDFRYEEGERRARSERAEMLGPTNEVFLNGSARIWDPTGSTSADTIHMYQKTGDFEANGKVTSTRLPEKKKGKAAPGMLSGEEPLQAKAARMIATDDNRVIVYEENALMWQGANRVQADRIRIDRRSGRLEARGKVETQLLEKANAATKKAQIFTVVRSPELAYDDAQRLAHYSGGAVLNRGPLVVNARDIRAFLKQGDSDSSLDHAYADGDVKIVETSQDRTRTGTAERAEYWTDTARVVLSGGDPVFVDSVQGTTRGQQITFYSNQDRLIVEGVQGKPVRSRIPRKGD
jgi:lipopolysaccharide export system protein LptA